MESVPGRGVLRISLTPICNLRCAHCHNEGQPPPWLHNAAVSASIGDIEALIRMGARRGAKVIRFTGGDPGVYPHLHDLLSKIGAWRSEFGSIGKWGLTTNGIPFIAPHNFNAIASSALTDIAIGVDSVEDGELSRPSSPVGVSGRVVFDRFIIPLSATFAGRIKIDIVFTGNKARTLNVIRHARAHGFPVTVLEVNGVMGQTREVRAQFEQLRNDVIEELALVARLNRELNEVELFDGEQQIAKFYPDHCRDRECGICRKLELRVHQTTNGIAAIPCYEQAQLKTIPLMVDGRLNETKFDAAIRLNGGGPEWFTKWKDGREA